MSDNNHSENKQFEYMGFKSPNGTIVPDDLFDVLMPQLKDGELRVLLYIIRKTFGWKKDSDDISLSQMVHGVVTKDGRVQDRGTGLKKSAVTDALKGLRAKKIIKVVRNRSIHSGNEPTTYMLRFEGEPDEISDAETPSAQIYSAPLSAFPDKGVSADTDKGLSGKTDTQETTLQTTGFNHSNIRRSTRSNNDFVDNSPSQPIISDTTEPSQHRHGMEDMAAIMQRQRGRPQNTSQAASSAVPTTVAATEPEPKPKRGKLRKDGYNEERQRLLAYVQDFARELRDQAPLRSSVTRAYNLYQRSGVHISRFEDAMYQAKAETQEYSATIRAQADGGVFPVKTKMAYWFACLEDELGLKDDDASPRAPN